VARRIVQYILTVDLQCIYGSAKSVRPVAPVCDDHEESY